LVRRCVVRNVLTAFAWGVLFAVGLVLSGMTQPGKVVGFLDVAGAWDPSLAWVMVGAISVHGLTRRWVLRRTKPVLLQSFSVPPPALVEVVGAALFGIGWGIAGYCPGPAIVASGSGSTAALVTTLAMLLGIKLAEFLEARPRQRRTELHPRLANSVE
jgi:uncharacterized protein